MTLAAQLCACSRLPRLSPIVARRSWPSLKNAGWESGTTAANGGGCILLHVGLLATYKSASAVLGIILSLMTLAEATFAR